MGVWVGIEVFHLDEYAAMIKKNDADAVDEDLSPHCSHDGVMPRFCK